MNEVLLVGATEELQTLAEDLGRADFHVRTCTPEEASERLSSGERIDVLLANLMEGDDLAALLSDRVAEHTSTLAVLRPEQLAGLDDTLPLDDFVVVPVATDELLARIRRARARREVREDTDILTCGELTIDQASYRVFVGSRPVELTYKEYELLRFLAFNQDRVCSREMLLSQVWGYDFYGGARTVDVHIRRLRSKIEGRGHTFIETVRNVGYRFHAG